MTKNTNQSQNQDPHIVTKFSQLKELALELGKLLKVKVAPELFPYLAQEVESKINVLLSSHPANLETLKAEIAMEESVKISQSQSTSAPCNND